MRATCSKMATSRPACTAVTSASPAGEALSPQVEAGGQEARLAGEHTGNGRMRPAWGYRLQPSRRGGPPAHPACARWPVL